MVHFLVHSVFDSGYGIAFKNENAKHKEHHTTEDDKRIFIVVDGVAHKRNAHSGEQAIQQIGNSSTQTGPPSRLTTLVQCALNAQYANRSHRC